MTIRVVPASEETFEAWLTMRAALYGTDGLDDARNRAEAKEILTTGRFGQLRMGCLMAAEGRLALGMVEVSVRDVAEFCERVPVGYLEGWFVEPSARGRGIGRLLADAACAWARDRGCRQLASDTQDWNAESARAHAGCGFRDMGLLRHFVRDL